jgi:hypothetical protein
MGVDEGMVSLDDSNVPRDAAVRAKMVQMQSHRPPKIDQMLA